MCNCIKAVEEERDFTRRCQDAASTETAKAQMDFVLIGYRASLEAIKEAQKSESP